MSHGSIPRVLPHVTALADPVTGLAAEGVVPQGLPWQEPDPDWGSAGRLDLHTAIDTRAGGPTPAAISTPPTATGRCCAKQVRARPSRTLPAALDAEVSAALRAAERDPAGLSDSQALALMQADGAELDALCALADDIRRDVVGDDVTYVVNRNINFTNVCYTGCRFCAFAQRRTDADAFTLSLDEVGKRADEAWAAGATEVCLQGGIHPDLPGTAYFDIAAEIRRRQPDLHIHAFSPMEIVNGASRTGLSIRDWLVKARESGLDSIPGTAAEILDDDVRWILTKGKLPTAELDRGGQHRPRGRTAVELDDDVRARRHPGPLGRAPAGAGEDPGRDRRIHRIRRAAVRAPEFADLPGRGRIGRARACGTTGRCTRWPGCCCTAGSTTSRRPG